MHNQLTHARLLEVLDYDPTSGVFTRKPRIVHFDRDISWNKRWANKVTGSDDHDGYLTIHLDGRGHRAHRLAWFYMTGSWPSKFIDHVNGNGQDNTWSNLREAGYNENNKNKDRTSQLGKSGHRGVVPSKNKWCARIVADKVIYHLGTFEQLQDAIDARLAAEIRLFGEYRRK